MFGLITKKQAEAERIEHGKKEYLRGAAATAEQMKDRQEQLDNYSKRLNEQCEWDKNKQLGEWETIKQAQKDIKDYRATVVLEGIKDLLAGKIR